MTFDAGGKFDSTYFGKDFTNMDGWFAKLNYSDDGSESGKLPSYPLETGKAYDANASGGYDNLTGYTSLPVDYRPLNTITIKGLENIYMDNVTSMVGTFSYLENIKFINDDDPKTEFDTSNVRNMDQCFEFTCFSNSFTLPS